MSSFTLRVGGILNFYPLCGRRIRARSVFRDDAFKILVTDHSKEVDTVAGSHCTPYLPRSREMQVRPRERCPNPITCKSAALSASSLPIANRVGDATADVFVTPPPAPDKIKDVLDVIADPAKSHFFNTDCVSCHTETRRAMELLNVEDIPGIYSNALPNDSWNVRNFGWSPAKGPVQATVTRRTAAETAAVVTFINSQMLAKPAQNR